MNKEGLEGELVKKWKKRGRLAEEREDHIGSQRLSLNQRKKYLNMLWLASGTVNGD